MSQDDNKESRQQGKFANDAPISFEEARNIYREELVPEEFHELAYEALARQTTLDFLPDSEHARVLHRVMFRGVNPWFRDFACLANQKIAAKTGSNVLECDIFVSDGITLIRFEEINVNYFPPICPN